MTFYPVEPSSLPGESIRPKNGWTLVRRWAPPAILAALAVLAYAMGVQHHLSLTSLAEHHDMLKGLVAEHFMLAILTYSAVYIAVVALSLPGAAALSVIGGLLFGWLVSAPVTVVAATIGATAVFLVVKSSLGRVIAERAGPLVKKVSCGFARDAFNYLLFLRLVPVFPFFVVNAVAGLCGVSFRSFVAATFFGIIPGSFVFSYLGRGLESVIEAQKQSHEACIAANGAAACPFAIDPFSLVTPELVIAFVALGIIALIPVVVRRYHEHEA